MHGELRTLQLTEPFRIAHGTSTERTVLRLSHEGVIAEAPFVPYYAESPEAALAAVRLPDARPLVPVAMDARRRGGA